MNKHDTNTQDNVQTTMYSRPFKNIVYTNYCESIESY